MEQLSAVTGDAGNGRGGVAKSRFDRELRAEPKQDRRLKAGVSKQNMTGKHGAKHFRKKATK